MHLENRNPEPCRVGGAVGVRKLDRLAEQIVSENIAPTTLWQAQRLRQRISIPTLSTAAYVLLAEMIYGTTSWGGAI